MVFRCWMHARICGTYHCTDEPDGLDQELATQTRISHTSPYTGATAAPTFLLQDLVPKPSHQLSQQAPHPLDTDPWGAESYIQIFFLN